MGTLLAKVSGLRRSTVLLVVIAAAGGLAYGGIAGASPQPTVSQVQAKINQLTTQFDQASEQLDQASEQLSTAKTKLTGVRSRLTTANAKFQAAQASVAQNAAAAFEDTGSTSVAGALTSGNPSAILQRGSMLLELSGNRSAQTRQLGIAAGQLAAAEQQVQRTESGIATLKAQLASHKTSLGKLIDTEKATLASLTVPQRHRHHLGDVHRADLDPGGKGRRLRLRPARQAVPVGRGRAGQLRLLGPGAGRLGLGRGRDTAHHLRAVVRPAAHLHVRARAR